MNAALARLRPASPALGFELVLFAALAAYATVHWGRLVVEPPVGRLALAVLAVCAVAAALGARREAPRRATPRRAPGVLAAGAAIVLPLLAVGLPVELLAPWNWGELREGVTQGLAGIEDVDLPYGGPDRWVRLTLLLGAGALLAAAALIGFWSVRRRELARAGALAVLLVLYGVAVTLASPPAELLWGAGLVVLAGAWLSLPRLAAPPARGALALLAAAGLALPIGALLASERPWWDYESWDWFGRDRTVTFDWNHSYGPLDWPQEGTTVLEARSDRPLYWKTTVLDRFDGFVWRRAESGDPLATGELAARALLPDTPSLAARNPQWVSEVSFEIRALESQVAVGAGTPLTLTGADRILSTPDGTLTVTGDPLASGADYTIRTYAPQPKPEEMRGASPRYPGRFAGSVLLGMPAPVPATGEEGAQADGPQGFGLAPAPAVPVPRWGRPRGAAGEVFRASPYRDAFQLARSLSAEASGPYEAASAIESHLRSGAFDYSQTVSDSTYPLASFLTEDRAGYCQQFSGSMALMLRMLGIPSRVVSGFAPGNFEPDADAYSVRDLDAHAWVEVYFRGLGWVTFDPTPAAAPAASQAVSPSGSIVPLRSGAEIAAPERGPSRPLDRPADSGAAVAPSEGIGVAEAIVLGLLAVGGGTGGVVYLIRRRRFGSTDTSELQTREFLAALGRLGWRVEPADTLLALDQRFERVGRGALSRYARALRANRYAPGGAAAPDLVARGDLRRALCGGAGGGLRRRIQALVAIPPGGPGRGG